MVPARLVRAGAPVRGTDAANPGRGNSNAGAESKIGTMRTRTLLTTAAAFFFVSLGLAAGWKSGGSTPAHGTGSPAPASRITTPEAPHAVSAADWKKVEQLVSEQKMSAAQEMVDRLLVAAIAAKDSRDWTRALIQGSTLRIAEGGFEGAVKYIKGHDWPHDDLSRATLDLYYAGSLVSYYGAYSWEINRRERVDTGGTADLRVWTRDQLYAAAVAAYSDAWKQRVALGGMPVVRLKPYLEPNDYPSAVRGTLRDALSYLYVELLADTSFWTPEQNNEIYRLDLPALIAGEPEASAKVALAEPQVHPLRKLGAVLDDLESWHRGAGHREAQLEARLERARRLAAALAQEGDRAKVRADLERRLPAFRDLSWWSEGMATLAVLVQGDPAPDALSRAHALLAAGEAAYPKTPGGRRCKALRQGLEAPDFSVSAMASDAPGKRSFEVFHRNLPRLYFRAYAFDLLSSVESSSRNEVFPQGNDARSYAEAHRPAAEWTSELPATPDFRSHRTFVVPPMKAAGGYLVLVSARSDFAEARNRVMVSGIVLGDLVLSATQEGGGESRLRLLSGEQGEPVAGAEVRVYRKDWQSGPQQILRATSDKDGFVLLPSSAERGGSWWGGIAIARHGADVAWLDVSLPGRQPEQNADAALLFTDRSVYRPQQRVKFKVLVYGGERREGHLVARKSAPVTVTLHDPNGQEVAKAELVTNGFGTAASEFTIPGGRPLGAWRLAASPRGSAALRVEEYKRPTFEVSIAVPAEALRLNRPAKLAGEARYYFGLPVAAGTARWRVTRQPVLPPWWSRWGWNWWGGGAPQAQVIAAGESPLADDGTFHAEFVPLADERAADVKGVSFDYRLAADVTDEGGETRSAERGFRLGQVAVQASIEAASGFVRPGETASLTVRRSDLDGAPRPGQGSWRLLALAQPAAPVMPADAPQRGLPPGQTAAAGALTTPGDGLRARWQTDADWRAALGEWSDGAELARGVLTHDAKGEASLTLPSVPPGAYRVRYQTQDPYGATAEAQSEVVVAGPGLALALPVVLAAEQTSVEAGGVARFLVWSGFADQALFFERYRDGALIERRRVPANSGVLEVPVAAADRGGFSVRLTLLRDHQLLQPVSDLAVPWTDRALAVAFSTFRDKLRPGTHETFRIKVSRADGGSELPAAEVLAYMYDRSLDLFAPHQPPRPLDLFPYRGGVGWASASLGQRGAGWVSQRDWAETESVADWTPDRLAMFDGYGVGGPGMRFRGVRGGVEGGVPTGAAAPQMMLDKAGRSDGAPPASPPPPVPVPELRAEAVSKPKAAASDVGAAAGAELRSNFSETAFWEPSLRTGEDGTATLEFDVPDSVTSWTVWAHAVTADLRSGSASRQTQSVKDLMVRPYLPRFLREGDRATLAVVVNNASASELRGTVHFELFDPRDQSSRLAQFGVDPALAEQPFVAKAGGSARLSIPVVAPREVGEVAVKVTASAGSLSDGELRPLPLLPSRMHLAQSRFVVLHDKERREMTFEDLRQTGDASRINEQMVVTLDAQLFYGVLQALPYLVNYPYECTEQTLNRFLSTGIVSSLFDKYPAVAKMAGEMAKRDTPFETFDGVDPNRKLALEETPWLELSQGKVPGSAENGDPDLVRVLDPRVARAEREAALAKLRKAQLPSGAFPWWPGGPPSDYMTLYLMYGFAKAAEFGVQVPEDMVSHGWQYLGERYREEFASKLDRADCNCNWEWITFLNYVASSYPDPSVMGDAVPQRERVRMLDASFRHWKEHSPYLKGFLALTLKRMGRPQNAKLVWDSVMDGAKTTPDEGTFWAPEERSWLWYNDTVESHAFALRALMELQPDDKRQDGLVQWLFLNKKLNHWKSTRATAEVLYSLAKYLEHTKQLGVREAATVAVAGQTTSFVFEPDRYTGKKNQIVVPGDHLSASSATVAVEKETPGLLFASATWHFSTEELPKEARGDLFHVTRQYFRRVKTGKEVVLQPLAEGDALAVGDELEVQLSLSGRAPAEYVHLRDPRGAGFEPENVRSGWAWDLGLPRYEEVRDSGTNFFIEWLPQGEYTLKYRVRASLAGTFRVGPATVQSMYAPEFTAYSAGRVLTVKGDK